MLELRIEAKASEVDEGYMLAVTCANEQSSKLKQIMRWQLLCSNSPRRGIPREINDKDVLTQAKSLKKKDGLGHIKRRIKSALEMFPKCKKARGKK